MIEITRYEGLSDEIRKELDFHIQEEFGHIPIVQETKWATPDWTIINFSENGIAAFYNIVERDVSINGKPLKIAGVNNVITPKKYRKKGYSTITLSETEDFLFNELKSDLGLLLCADDLVSFYSRLNWYKVDCPVYFEQPNEHIIWPASTMLLSERERIIPKTIDLNGLPW